MKDLHVSRLGWLVVLLVAAALIATPIAAQEQVHLDAVRPASGQAGQELDVTLQGGGFGGANEAQVTINGLEVWDAQIESDRTIRARVYIPDGAEPGPRNVQVVVSFGQNEDFSATLPGGFTVLEPEGPGPVDRDDDRDDDRDREEPRDEPRDLDWPWWVAILVVALLGLGGVTLAASIAVKVRRSSVQQREQIEEQKEDHSQEECESGTHKVVREDPEFKPGRWKVTGIKVTLYDSTSGQRGTTRDAPPDLANRVDKAARHRLLHGESETLAEQVTEIARELAALIVAWQSLAETERDVYLEPHIEGGEASAKFVRYACVAGRWQKETEWEVELTAVDHFPGTFRGPGPSEDATAYRALLEEHLRTYLHDLLGEIGRLL